MTSSTFLFQADRVHVRHDQPGPDASRPLPLPATWAARGQICPPLPGFQPSRNRRKGDVSCLFPSGCPLDTCSLPLAQLWLQHFRELTVLMPTWFFSRQVFDRVGSFVEADPSVRSSKGQEGGGWVEWRGLCKYCALGVYVM